MAYPGAPAQQLNAWLDAGLNAHRRGDLEGALAAYRRVLAAAPAHGPALNLLGTALLQLGQAAQAVPYLERAAGTQRDDPRILANLAQAYLALKRYAEARETFRKASRIAPQEVQLHVGVAAALALGGELDQALTLLQRLAARFPQAPLVWLNLGNVLRDQRRPEEALQAYRAALELDPQSVDARNSAGSVLHSMLRFSEAEREYRACIAAHPDDLVPRFNLASVTMDMGRYAEAEAVSRELLSRAPDVPAAHRLLGSALAQQARLLDALTCYERAAQIAPGDHPTAQAYGTALMEAGHSAAGLRWLAHAVFLEPDSVSCKQVEGGALLAHGCLQDGWRGYAHRSAALALREEHRARHPVLSLPQDLAGKHLCVLAEQGLGDELFFLRYTPLLAARGARVSCRPAGKLHSLLERAAAIDPLLPENAELPQADFFMLAGDLPHALGELASSALRDAGRRADGFPALPDFRRQIRLFWPQPAPTLRMAPLPGRMKEIADRLAAFGPPPYLGITWRGGTAPEEQQDISLLHKSIALPALSRALEAVPGTIVALQRRPARGEMDALAASLGRPVHDLTGLNDDLEGMLALLALADEYIGVSNTNMHLRAAVGKSARVLVPVPAEWRWMQSGRSSPWFPGFAIYRQSLQGDWSHALARLARELQASHGVIDRSRSA